MSFFSGLNFFVLLGFIFIPAVILGLLGKPLKYYRMIASILVIGMVFGDNYTGIVYLLIFLLGELALIKGYLKLRTRGRNVLLYRSCLALSLIPLGFCKISEVANFSVFQFLGISYLTFRVVQIIIEIYDNVIKEITISDYFDFILCFTTFSSGPIDRSRRYLADSHDKLNRVQYLELLGTGLQKILIGVLYKVVLSATVFQYVQTYVGKYTIVSILKYSYCYGVYMFFDFAGYSLMAVGASYILGIKTPDNFNKPFISLDMKDFWNRWHMSLSFWFRDFIFSRIMMNFIKKKYFKSKLTGASIAFIINMTIMGIWHGLAWQYIVYGIYHGILLAVTEVYQKKSQFYKKNKKKKWYKCISWALTINLVMFGFLIFSGEFTHIVGVLIGRL